VPDIFSTLKRAFLEIIFHSYSSISETNQQFEGYNILHHVKPMEFSILNKSIFSPFKH